MTDNSDSTQQHHQAFAWPAIPGPPISIPLVVNSTLRSVDEIAADIDTAEQQIAARFDEQTAAAETVAAAVLPAERVSTSDIERGPDGLYHCPECDFTNSSKQGIGVHRHRRHSPPEVMQQLGAKIGAANRARHAAKLNGATTTDSTTQQRTRGQGRAPMLNADLERIVERMTTKDRSHLLKRRRRAVDAKRNIRKWEADELAKLMQNPPTLVDFVTPASVRPVGRPRGSHSRPTTDQSTQTKSNYKQRPAFSVPALERLVDTLPKQLRRQVLHGRAEAIRFGRNVVEYETRRLEQLADMGYLDPGPIGKPKTITSAVVVRPSQQELDERAERDRADDLFGRVAKATDVLFPERVPSERIIEVAGLQQEMLRTLIR